jgi:hypothetical protein
MDTIDKKYKEVIYFEELPKNIQHALEVLVEWHSVLVYQQPNGRYGFTILDKYMPTFSDFTGLIESKYVNANHFIQESIQKIIDTEYEGARCAYFPKGNLESESMQISVPIVCNARSEYGFSIEIHSTSYGFLDNEKAEIAPAYAHVLDEEELPIGLLNISGPCPQKVADVKEFKFIHEFEKPKSLRNTPLMKHRRNIVKWANHSAKGSEYNNWQFAKEIWGLIHYKGEYNGT